MVKLMRYVGVTLWRFVLWLWLLQSCFAFHGILPDGRQKGSNCTQADQGPNKNSFTFLQLGNASSLEQCLGFCCGNELCELVIRSGTNCYGVSCTKPEMCHRILDQFVREADDTPKVNSSSAQDQAVTETAVEVTDARCPQRIIPTFAILLQKSRPVHGFVKLHGMGTSREECKRKCCERSDCQISFLDNQLCYGLVCAGGPACRAQSFPRQQTYLQLAIIERNREVTRSLDDTDEDDGEDDLGSDASDGKGRDKNSSTQHGDSDMKQAQKRSNGGRDAKNAEKQERAKQRNKVDSPKSTRHVKLALREKPKRGQRNGRSRGTKRRDHHARTLGEKKQSAKMTAIKDSAPSFLFRPVKTHSHSRPLPTRDSTVGQSKPQIVRERIDQQQDSSRADTDVAVPSFLFVHRTKKFKGTARSEIPSARRDSGKRTVKKSSYPLFLVLLNSSKQKESAAQSLKRSKAHTHDRTSKVSEKNEPKPTLPSFLFSVRQADATTLKSNDTQANSRAAKGAAAGELSKKSGVSSVAKPEAEKGKSEERPKDESKAPAFLFRSKKLKKGGSVKVKARKSSTGKDASPLDTLVEFPPLEDQMEGSTDSQNQKAPAFLFSSNDKNEPSLNSRKRKTPRTKYPVISDSSGSDRIGSGRIGDEQKEDEVGSASEYQDLLVIHGHDKNRIRKKHGMQAVRKNEIPDEGPEMNDVVSGSVPASASGADLGSSGHEDVIMADHIKQSRHKKQQHHATTKHHRLRVSETDDVGSGEIRGYESGDESGSASEYQDLLMPKHVVASDQAFSGEGADLMSRAQEQRVKKMKATQKQKADYSGSGLSGDDSTAMRGFDGSGVGDVDGTEGHTSGLELREGDLGSTGDILMMKPKPRRGKHKSRPKGDSRNQILHVPKDIRNKDIVELRAGQTRGRKKSLHLDTTVANAAKKRKTSKAIAKHDKSRSPQKGKANKARHGNHSEAKHKSSDVKWKEKALQRGKQNKSVGESKKGFHGKLTKSIPKKRKHKNTVILGEDAMDLMNSAHRRKFQHIEKSKKVKAAHWESQHKNTWKEKARTIRRKGQVIPRKTKAAPIGGKAKNSKETSSAFRKSTLRKHSRNFHRNGAVVNAVPGKRAHTANSTRSKISNKDHGLANKAVIVSRPGVSSANTSKKNSTFLSHFVSDSGSTNELALSVKSSSKHKKHRKKEIQIDADDLGDADFDIMMSNDIPHKDIPKPKKKKSTFKKHRHKKAKTTKKGKVHKAQMKDSKRKKRKKHHKPYVILGEDAEDDDNDDDKDIIRGIVKFQGKRHGGGGGREGGPKSHLHRPHKTKASPSDDSSEDKNEKEEYTRKRGHIDRTDQKQSDDTEQEDRPPRHHHHHHHHKKIHAASDENHGEETEARDGRRKEGQDSEAGHRSEERKYESENDETKNEHVSREHHPQRHVHRHHSLHHTQHYEERGGEEERRRGRVGERGREKSNWGREHRVGTHQYQEQVEYKHHGGRQEEHRTHYEEQREREHGGRQEGYSTRHEEFHDSRNGGRRRKHHHHRLYDAERHRPLYHDGRERENEVHEKQEDHRHQEQPERSRVIIGEDTDSEEWRNREFHKQGDAHGHGGRDSGYPHREHAHSERVEGYHENDRPYTTAAPPRYEHPGHEAGDETSHVDGREHQVEAEQPEGDSGNHEKWAQHESHNYGNDLHREWPDQHPHDVSGEQWRANQDSREQPAQAESREHHVVPPEVESSEHHVVLPEVESREHHVGPPEAESREHPDAASRDYHMPYAKSGEGHFEKFGDAQSYPSFEHRAEGYPHSEGDMGTESANHIQREEWRQPEKPAFGFNENQEKPHEFQPYEHHPDGSNEKFWGHDSFRNGFEGRQNAVGGTEPHPPWGNSEYYSGGPQEKYANRDGRPAAPYSGPSDDMRARKQYWGPGTEHPGPEAQWRFNHGENYNNKYHTGNPDNFQQWRPPPWVNWLGNPWQSQMAAPPGRWPGHTSGNPPWGNVNGQYWPSVGGQSGVKPPPVRIPGNNVGNVSQAVEHSGPTVSVAHSSPSIAQRSQILTQPVKVESKPTVGNMKTGAASNGPAKANNQAQTQRGPPSVGKNTVQSADGNKTVQLPSPSKPSSQSQGTPQKVINKVGGQTTYKPTVKQQPTSTAPPQPTKRLTTTAQTTKHETAGSTAKSQPDKKKTQAPAPTNRTTSQGESSAAKKEPQNKDKTTSVGRLNGFFNEEKKAQQGRKNGPEKSDQHPHPLHPTKGSSEVHTNAHAPTRVSSHVTQAHKTTHPLAKSTKSSVTTGRVKTAKKPKFGEEGQPDDITEEKGSKQRKHRAPVCHADRVLEDTTLARGRRAGNFTKIGDVGDFDICIKHCCQDKLCDVAYKSAETCFLVHCFSKDSCETSDSMTDFFNPKLCFVRRRSKEEDDDDALPGGDQDRNGEDKLSPSGIREVCEAEKALGQLWRKTAAGRISSNPCPRKATGFVKRQCEADSRWLPPDFSECVSSGYRDLYEKSKKLADGADPSPLIRGLSQLTTQNIDNSLILGGDLIKSQEIMAAIVQNNGQTDLLGMTRDDLENFVRAGSNLLDLTNQQGWFSIQKSRPGSADVLRAIEMFALQAAMRLPRRDMSEPVIFNNIIIKIDRKSTAAGALSFPDYTDRRIDRWDVRHDVITLNPSAFKRGEVSAASISFKSLPYLLPDLNSSSGLGPNSKVISTIVHPAPPEVISPPITIVLSHIKPKRGNPKCVFWDYTIKPHLGGGWSSRGCWLARNNDTHSVCQCSHLSNFAVLMDISADEVSEKEQKRERTMALMWIGIPVLIVGIIGALYMSFTWNRKPGGSSTAARQTLNEKTGLLGQRVVTSQIKEQYPPSPTRDLYRALSPAYSPIAHDLEWQDEFEFGCGPHDSGLKKILMPHLQILQKHLTQEFGEIEKGDAKRIFSENKDPSMRPSAIEFSRNVGDQLGSPSSSCSDSIASVSTDSGFSEEVDATEHTTPEPHGPPNILRGTISRTKTHRRVTFAEGTLSPTNRTRLEKERFENLQKIERRVFLRTLRRWQETTDLNTLPE